MSEDTIVKKMKELNQRNRERLFDDRTINLAFDVIKEHPNPTEQCRAAVILSGIVKKGLGRRTKKFLDDNHQLPARAAQILRSSIMRMEGY
jgi:hypothetical protein